METASDGLVRGLGREASTGRRTVTMGKVLAAAVSAALFAVGWQVGWLAGKLARRRHALVLGFVAGLVKAYEAGEAPPGA